MKKIKVKIQFVINPDQLFGYVALFGVPCLIVGAIVYNCIVHGTNLALLV